MNHYEDTGQVTLCEDFPYSQVESDLAEGGPVQLLRRINGDPIGAACECQRKIEEWKWGNACEDLDGYLCRCIVASWIFVPALRSYSMTEMAARVGKKKQSLGRQVDDFKRRFPEIKHLQHMRFE